MSPVITPEFLAHRSRAEWVEAERYGTVLKGVLGFRWMAAVCVLILATLSWHAQPRWAWWTLVLGSVVMLGLRVTLGRSYRARAHDFAGQLAFARSLWWFWPLNAASWGAWPWLFHEQLPPQFEAASWMVLLGVGIVATAWMSAQRTVAHGFLSTLFILVLASVLWGGTQEADGSPESVALWLLILLLGYWTMLRISAHLSDLYGSSLDLSYHNARLIEFLKERTRAADEAARFKDRFLAGVAHDLKQPVNALGIYAEWLCTEPELVEELGPKLLQATQAINALFDTMIDMAKVGAGRIAPRFATVSVPALLDELAVQFGPLAVQKGLALRVRPLQAQLVSDPLLLERVVGNLLTNAIRYTPRGAVLLAARRDGQGIRFEVWDTGIGIGEQEQARIFDEFYKVRKTGTEEGFGLGLAIVRRLSEQLGCHISMRSRPGRGSVFRVWVPTAPQTLPEAPAPLRR